MEGGIRRVFDLLPISAGLVMVPFLAALLILGSRARKRFVAHLVFSLHLHTIAYTLAGVGWFFGVSRLPGSNE